MATIEELKNLKPGDLLIGGIPNWKYPVEIILKSYHNGQFDHDYIITLEVKIISILNKKPYEICYSIYQSHITDITIYKAKY